MVVDLSRQLHELAALLQVDISHDIPCLKLAACCMVFVCLRWRQAENNETSVWKVGLDDASAASVASKCSNEHCT